VKRTETKVFKRKREEGEKSINFAVSQIILDNSEEKRSGRLRRFQKRRARLKSTQRGEGSKGKGIKPLWTTHKTMKN